MTEWGILSLVDNSASAERTAHVMTTYEQNYIFTGNSLKIETVFAVGSADAEYDISFDTTGMSRQLIALPTTWATTAGPIIITLGVCTSYSSGTEITPTNRNYAFQTSFPSEVTFKYDVTTVEYAASPTVILVGTSATNQSSGGGSTTGTLPIVLETGLRYIFRVNNGSGEAISLFGNIEWYELA